MGRENKAAAAWRKVGAGRRSLFAPPVDSRALQQSRLGRLLHSHSTYGIVPPKKVVAPLASRRPCIRNTTSSPLFKPETILRKSSSLFTGLRLTSKITSPWVRPTSSSANEPGFTSCTTTPFPGGTPRRSADSGVTLFTATPPFDSPPFLLPLPPSS